MSIFFVNYFLVFLIPVVLNMVILHSSKYHGSITFDVDGGVQKIHETPTPRIGGIPIYVGIFIGCLMVSQEYPRHTLFFALVVFPAFLVGLAEDLTKSVSPFARLLGCSVGAVLGLLFLDFRITRVDFPIIDYLLTYSWVSVACTVIAVVGFSNAINIVDGLNGLAGGIFVVGTVAIGVVAYSVDDQLLVQLCVVSVLSVLGFLVFNFPLGKIFLGDGGAYLLGAASAWLSIALVYRNPSVSAWVPVTIFGYSIIEVMATIFRRLLSGALIMGADRMHLHSLLRVFIISKSNNRSLGAMSRGVPVVVFCWLFVGLSSVGAVVYYRDPLVCGAIFFVALLIYAGFYGLASRGSKMKNHLRF